MQRKDIVSRLAARSGATSDAPKYLVPAIRFNGNTGVFRKVMPKKSRNDEPEEVELGEEITVTIVKNRKKLENYDEGYSTPEFNSMRDMVTLFQDKNGKYAPAARENAKTLRELYPSLKYHEVLYVLHEGEICKLEIKSSSLKSYYEYRDELKKDGQHSFEVETVVSTDSAPNPKKRNSKYFFMIFSKGGESDIERTEEAYDEIEAKLGEIDAYRTAKENGNAPTVKPTAAARMAAQDDDNADLDEVADITPDDDKNPADIPF